MPAFFRNLMNDIISSSRFVPFIVPLLLAFSLWSKINERVSARQERATYCRKITGTSAVRNNVSSGRDCLGYISARLSDNKATAPIFVHDVPKMHREMFDFYSEDEISGRSGAVKRYSTSEVFFFFLNGSRLLERMALLSPFYPSPFSRFFFHRRFATIDTSADCSRLIESRKCLGDIWIKKPAKWQAVLSLPFSLFLSLSFGEVVAHFHLTFHNRYEQDISQVSSLSSLYGCFTTYVTSIFFQVREVSR